MTAISSTSSNPTSSERSSAATSNSGGPHQATGQSRSWIPWAIALSLAAPLLALFVVAAMDGYKQRHEAPLRAVLGNRLYEDLQSGVRTPRHYLGNNLRAPDFTLPDQQGKPWRLKQHRGKTIVLNFWSVTCDPCIKEMPSLISLAQIAKEWGDTEVVTLSIDKGWKEVREVFKGKAPFPVLFDPKQDVVKKRFGTKLYPETWIIDKNGIIRLRIDGARDWSKPLMLDTISLFR